jgi:hypothetical protein
VARIASIETNNANEAPKMRRVRNQRIHTSNPSLLFARGVESIVSEHMNQPRYAEADKKSAKQAATVKYEPQGNLFTLLMRQFASQ